MKTQVIQLSQNDDVVSVCEKMGWSQAGRILLVWPNHGELLNRKLDLNLIARHAAGLGAQVALVTRDPKARFYAHQLKIQVFANPKDAQDAEWEKFQRPEFHRQDNERRKNLADLYRASHPTTPGWLEHPVTKVSCLMISVLALLGLVVFILPGAKIILTPRVESQSMVFNLTIDPSLSSISYSTGSLPVYYHQVIVEGMDEANATGSVSIPDQPATCELRFTNNSHQTFIIPAGTLVSTIGINPIRFMITSQGDTTIKPDDTVVLPARAVKPGLSGNLAAGKLVVIEGNLEPGLRVTNPDPTSGGTDANVASPTIEDMHSLRQRLVSKLMQEALLELHSALPDGDILITPTITNGETITETVTSSVGEPGNELELTIKLRVQAQAISSQAVSMLVNPLMDANTPKGYSPQPDTFEFAELSHPTVGEDGKAHWIIRATRKLSATVPAGQVAEMVRGNTISQSMFRLSSSLPLAEPASISLAPSWWPRLPFLAMRIEVFQKGVQ